MKGRTARAIHRLKQSSDFKEIMEHLKSEQEIFLKTIVTTKDEVTMVRTQGTLQFLNGLLDDIENSELIGKRSD